MKDISIFNIISYKNILRSDDKWNKLIKDLNKDCNIYYQWIEPKLCDFELLIVFQKELLIHEAKSIYKINITITDGIPDKISKGIIKIIDNLLIYIETDEELKPIYDQTNNINKAISKLSNQKFLENANLELIELEKKKLEDFKKLQIQKTLNIFFEKFGIDFINLILKFHSLEKIYWNIQFFREKNTIFDKYSKEWFEYIYNTNIEQDEINYLKNL